MAPAQQWVKVADYITQLSFAPNNMTEVTVKGKKICIGKYNEVLYAFASKCPHASGILANGYIDMTGNVVCPVHRYKFCIKNGRNVSGEGYYLKHWPVDVREDGVFIALEQSSFFDWL